MKITTMLAAAGLAVASFGVSTAATAQSWGHDRDSHRDGYRDRDGYRGHDRDRDRYRDRRYNRDRHYGYDRRGYGWGRHRDHCRTVWRYGHRVRICR